jgi:predicted nucleic acid-binding protein
MKTWADSSFVVSLCIDDVHTEKARRYFAANPFPVSLTAFSMGEVQHALRLCAFRGEIPQQRMTQALLRFERDQSEGFFEPVQIESSSLFERTSQLSQRYALSHGTRYLDVLHVAAALLCKCRRFLTFDERQGRLAKTVGLEVKP